MRLFDTSKDDKHLVNVFEDYTRFVMSDEEHCANDDYKITRDKIRKMIRVLERYGFVELVVYSSMAASEVLEDEPSSVSSLLASKEKTKWLNALNKEMKSLT